MPGENQIHSYAAMEKEPELLTKQSFAIDAVHNSNCRRCTKVIDANQTIMPCATAGDEYTGLASRNR